MFMSGEKEKAYRNVATRAIASFVQSLVMTLDYDTQLTPSQWEQ